MTNNKIKMGKCQYRYDFLIILKNKKKIIIELDGDQHFNQVWNWKSPLECQIRDKYKELMAFRNNIYVYRYSQKDVYHDKNCWEEKIKKQLNKCYKKYN